MSSCTDDYHNTCVSQRQHADLAGKITGMLLEIDNSELLHMLEDPASLQGKVQSTPFILYSCKKWKQRPYLAQGNLYLL